MSRRAARVDRNQAEIVGVLRQVGFSVEHLHGVGGGVPDLLIGRHGLNYLVEIKDGSKAPSAARLNARQVEWHADWRGQSCVMSSVDQVIAWACALPGRG
jgi:hypothetical protein